MPRDESTVSDEVEPEPFDDSDEEKVVEVRGRQNKRKGGKSTFWSDEYDSSSGKEVTKG